jgi:RNA polymerase sigma factor (TIGR02999 family)
MLCAAERGATRRSATSSTKAEKLLVAARRVPPGRKSYSSQRDEFHQGAAEFRLSLRVGLQLIYSSMSDVTEILDSFSLGDSTAADRLLGAVYEELRQMAAARMARESPGHMLQPTALVHEAWLRLHRRGPAQWQNRAHFFGAAAEAMRRILIDTARRNQAVRHGSGQAWARLTNLEIATEENYDHVLAVNEAYEKFATLDPRKAELVKLRYFAGLSMKEAIEILGVPERTAHRWWTYARAWFQEELTASG